jgi:hypothetical protein
MMHPTGRRQSDELPTPKSNEQYPAAPVVGFKDSDRAYAARRAFFAARNKAIQERSSA